MIVAPVRLFDELIRLNAGDVKSFTAARHRLELDPQISHAQQQMERVFRRRRERYAEC